MKKTVFYSILAIAAVCLWLVSRVEVSPKD